MKLGTINESTAENPGQAFKGLIIISVPSIRKCYTEQMFVSAGIQLRNHATSEPFQALQGLCDIPTILNLECWNLEVRENEISLRKLSGGTAHLCTLGETLIITHRYIS